MNWLERNYQSVLISAWVLVGFGVGWGCACLYFARAVRVAQLVGAW